MKRKYIKKFKLNESDGDWRKMGSPEESVEQRSSNRRDFSIPKGKQQNDNRLKIEEDWVGSHPLEGVTMYNEPAIGHRVHYYENGNNNKGFSADFNSGNEYIVVTLEDGRFETLVRCGKIGNPQALISWLHKAMIYLQCDHMFMDKALKEIEVKIKEW